MRQTREEEQAYWDAKIASAQGDIDRMLNPDIQDSVIDHYQLAVITLDRIERHKAAALARFDVPAQVREPAPQLEAQAEETPVFLSEDAPSDPLGPLEALETGLTRLQAQIDAVRAGTQELSPDELISMHRDDPPGAAAKLEDAIRALKGDARRKLSELLNVELAELKNLRGMAGEDREREQQIEYLLGLFTRLGEI